MKVLVTGASGFVGRHLVEHLAQDTTLEIVGTSTDEVRLAPRIKDRPIDWYQLDIRDEASVIDLLGQIQPKLIFHLAGQAFVPLSLEHPWETLQINVQGQLNLIKGLVAHGLDARLLAVSSAHVYGKIDPADNPITEQQPFRPDTPYAVSKIAQDMLALQYYLSHGLQIVRARAFNHIGPGQNTRFALPNFARQIAAIEQGQQEPIISVGDLKPRRDFTDVRDVVRAYALLLQHGQSGEAYNVCRGRSYAIGDLLDKLCALSSADIRIQQDPSRLRSLDVSEIIGDNRKLRQDTGWQPTISIERSLRDILQQARQAQESDFA